MYHLVAREAGRSVRRGERGFVVAFALFWNGFIGTAVAVCAYGGWRQIETGSWPTADGVVTVSRYSGKRTKGRVGWELAYTYTVAGRAYTGTRYAFDPMPVQGRETDRAIAAFPAGAAVTVWHDPADPGVAVLRPGLRGCTLWVALFLTPFVMIGAGLAAGAVGLGRRVPVYPPPDADAAVVQLTQIGPAAAFLGCLGLIAFGTAWSLFMLGFALGVGYWLFDGFVMDPPVWVPAAVWVAVLVASGVAARRLVRAAPTLTTDDAGRRLVLGPAGVEVPFAAVRAVAVAEVSGRNRSGLWTRYRVDLARDAGPLALAEYDDRTDADALAAWVRARVGRSA